MFTWFVLLEKKVLFTLFHIKIDFFFNFLLDFLCFAILFKRKNPSRVTSLNMIHKTTPWCMSKIYIFKAGLKNNLEKRR